MQLSIVSHIAANPTQSICGLDFPSFEPATMRPVRGSRVGVVTGKFTSSAYVITHLDADSNEMCPRCREAAR